MSEDGFVISIIHIVPFGRREKEGGGGEMGSGMPYREDATNEHVVVWPEGLLVALSETFRKLRAGVREIVS